MIWHANNQSQDGLVCHVVDSKQWEFIDKKWPSFGNEPRNVRLGLFIDGLNPFGEKHSKWYLWLVLLVNYNILPWFTTKKHFMMLYLIILGPTTITCEQFDIFIEPLVEKLKILWDVGVNV
jgi:hypothetical protein